MSTFVLVHGSWHGAWCWETLASFLRERGHQVLTPDLPAHGADQTSVAEVTLQAYADRVVKVVDSAAEPVILVGHSMGGVVISIVAEARPDRIRRLVYVAAFLLQDGQSLLQIGQSDRESLILPNLRPSADQSQATLQESALDEIFYHDCEPHIATAAKARLRPEPMLPVVTPIRISRENHGRIPRAYVRCGRDHAISPSAQQHMVDAMPCDPVLALDSGHSPFLSMPAKLCELLLQLA